MDPLTIAIGVLAVGIGLATGVLRMTAPTKLKKLGPMQDRFGATAGSLVHLLFYTVLPLAFGGVALLLGLHGRSLF